MAFYDEERILEDADALSVFEYLGLEIRRSGSRHQIYCPGHEKRLGKPDSKMGSCVITPKGYHCYACDVQVGLINAVMEILDCDYKEALCQIADSLGGRELYETSGKKETSEIERILREDDLKLIGLSSTVSFDIPVNLFSSKEEINDYNKKIADSDDEIKRPTLSPKTDGNSTDDTYLGVYHQNVSLKSIYQESPTDYYYMVKTKSKEAMDKYKSYLDGFEDSTSKEYTKLSVLLKTLGSEIDESKLFEFKDVFRKWYTRAKEIYLSITPEMAGIKDEVEIKKEIPEEEPSIRLDLFSNL